MGKTLFKGGLALAVLALPTAALADIPINTARKDQPKSDPGSWRFATGLNYSSGDYGDPANTNVLSIPFGLKYQRGAFSVRVWVPYVWINGPGSLIQTPEGRDPGFNPAPIDGFDSSGGSSGSGSGSTSSSSSSNSGSGSSGSGSSGSGSSGSGSSGSGFSGSGSSGSGSSGSGSSGSGSSGSGSSGSSGSGSGGSGSSGSGSSGSGSSGSGSSGSGSSGSGSSGGSSSSGSGSSGSGGSGGSGSSGGSTGGASGGASGGSSGTGTSGAGTGSAGAAGPGAVAPGIPIPGSQNRSGIGDFVIGATYSIDMGHDFYTDVTGRLKIPTASVEKRMGTGKVDFTIGVDLIKDINNFSIYVGGRRRFVGQPDNYTLRDVWGAGAGVSARVSRTTSIGIDYDWQQSSFADTGASSELTAWASFRVIQNLRVQFYGGTGFTTNSANVIAGIAASWRFN